jgi:hypothetical protein
MSPLDYWKECISIAADECGLTLTNEQLACLAGSVESGHENYGMAFYTPPPSDRINDIEREWKHRLAALQAEFDVYRDNAETAVKRALRQHIDAQVTIGEYGEVFRHGGRTEQIQ